MSSSMRNAIQRRNHKERAQPQAREKKWGLLEKSKDWKLRAADNREKKKRTKVLKTLARDRNPDEFSFRMMSTQSSKGVKIGDRGNTALSHEVVSLLKTQDAGYLRTVLMRTGKEIERLQGALKLRDGKVETVDGQEKGGLKTVFVDSVEDQDTYRKAVDDEDPQSSNEDWEGFSEEDGGEEEGPRSQQQTLRKLKALKKREAELIIASRELELQRAKMSNSIGGVNKNGVKWKIRERKR